jgi:DnaD/phage-associated family protein
VKVYLYGLYQCAQPENLGNSLEHFAKVLNLAPSDVESAFYYWQEQGLIQILEKEPFEVVYLPIKENLGKLKKFDEKKYGSFNIELQELIIGRMITPTEYKEYYELMESFHIEPAAVLMIVKYATSLQGGSVGYKYITTIIKNWAYEGILTTHSVEQKLMELEQRSGNILETLKALGLKRGATFEERNLFLKWTKDFGFLLEDIIRVAKTLKRKGGFFKLDTLLTKYYELKLFSYSEIEHYEQEKEGLFDLAKQIARTIGVYYENLSMVVETYIADWLKKGYDHETLILVANYCFRKNIRTLEGMDATIKKFYSRGLVSSEGITEYLHQKLALDKQIAEILNACGLHRKVITNDRENFALWTNTWGFSNELILYAASLSVGKLNPVSYLHKILSNWHEQNIKTLEDAKKTTTVEQKQPKTLAPTFQTRSYSSEEMNALFDNLDEVDI